MFLQLFCLWSAGSAYTTLHVNWDTGVDNSTCRKGSIPCATLAYALADLHSDTAVHLDNKNVTHRNVTIIQSEPISNITINGTHGNTVIDCFESGAFAFINVSELTIANVEFRGCGVLQNSTCYDAIGRSTSYVMALYLYNCTDVSIVSTTVSYSPGAGVVMLAVRGRVNVTDSKFLHNGFRISRNGSHINESALVRRLGGGGLKIELPSCPPGVNSVDCNGTNDVCPPEGAPVPEYSDIAYNIEDCSFISNTAEAPNVNTYGYGNFPDTDYFTTIGRGGGLSIVVKGTSHRIRATVTSCQFKDNWSLYGAGAFMELWHRPDNVSLSITGSNFTHNHVPYNSTKNIGTGGGGLRYSHQYCTQHQHEGNTLLVTGCKFDYNRGYWGGGVSLALLPQQNSLQGDVVAFERSLFSGNVARIGAAINFYPKSSMPLQAMLQDMEFVSNSVIYGDDPSYINGEGIVCITSTVLYVKSSLNVSHNQGNGISSLYGTVHFLNNSSSFFYGNHAFRGAALALYGNADIVLHNASQLNFTENLADTVGGAIYHAALGNRAVLFIGNGNACPIRLADKATNWNEADVTLHFINNAATGNARGASIYVSSFFPCVQGSLDDLNATFNWRPFHYACDNQTIPNCRDFQVSGDGSIVKPTRNPTLSMIAFPGELAPLPFTVEDELHNKVHVHFEGVVHDNNTSNYAVDVLNGANVIVTGTPKKGAQLELHSIESQTLSVVVNLDITDCPPGFLLKKNNRGMLTCQCAPNETSVSIGIRCDADSKTSTLDYHHWVGYLMADNNSHASVGFQTGYCPPGFCRDTSLTLNGSDHYNFTSLNEIVCGPQNRTGVLCGKCKEGYGTSVLLNEWFQCVPCSNSSSGFKVFVIWFFSEFIPLNILIIIFIVFNVNILSGWGGALYGVVFYFQVVSSTPAFQYQAPSSTVKIHSDGWYGWSLYINKFLSNLWNLIFFSGFTALKDSCMATTSSAQLAILITYVQILVWPLVVYICFLSIHKCYHYGYCCGPTHRCLFKMGRILAKSRDSGGFSSLVRLCSFFVLAYTRLVRLTAQIVGRVKLITYTNSSVPQEDFVFLYNGTVPWFDRYAHAPYAVPILLCSFVCVFIPTLLLVSFPLLPKLLVKLNLNERQPFRWLISLLSTSYLLFLYDIFQGCFKPNARYFAALYLIYRHLFVIAWAYTTTLMRCSLWQIILGVSFITIHFLAQPFSNNAVNKITGLVIADLTLVVVLAQYSTMTEGSDDLAIAAKVFTIMLLYLPHLGVACLFSWVVLRYIYQRSIVQRCAPKRAAYEASPGHELEESAHHGAGDDWDASFVWNESQVDRVDAGYVHLEEEQEEEDLEVVKVEEEEDGAGENAAGQAEQVLVHVRRHASVHKGYGSLADYRKTQ